MTIDNTGTVAGEDRQPTLYHCADARSLRCLWALEESGLPCRIVNLPFPPRALAPAFKAVNPLGTVPAWVEQCPGGALLLTESVAICERIACGTNLALTPDAPDFWAYRNWLHRSDATLTFPLALVLRYGQLEQDDRRQPQVVADYRGFFEGRARAIETALADDRHWLMGPCFTLADITVGYATFLATRIGCKDLLGPLTTAWLARCMTRDGFARARARQDAPTSF